MTFEEFWEKHGYDYVTTKDLARDAWFAGQKVINDHEVAVTAARAEVDALDAARYRWLRREEEPNGAEPFICRRAPGSVFTRWTGKEADAAVDSTIALHDMNKDE